MPARTPTRRHLAAAIAGTEKSGGPRDPRLPALRQQLGDTRALDEAKDGLARAASHSDPGIRAWARLSAAALPAFGPAEIDAAGRVAAAIDARIRAAGDGNAATP